MIGAVGRAMAKSGTALVTGASEGIGRALAEVFARHGHDLVLTARNGERLESLAAALGERHGTEIHCLALDLGQPGGAQALFEAVGRLEVEIEILVNNAGFGLYGPFHARELARHQELIQLNIAALTTLCHLFGAPMIARGRGRILNVASTVAFLPGPLMASYFASKAYVLRLSEALALELEGQGVGVTCLCPGLTESRFHERAGLLDTSLLRFSQASARSVAEAGYRGCMAGRTIVLPGFRNRFVPLVERVLPRAPLRRIVYAFMSRR